MSELRRVTKDIYDCDADGKQRPYDYPESDVRTLESQVSEAGVRLVTLSIRLPEDLAERCGPILGPVWESHTFVVPADGRIEHLGTLLKFLDAGDFDGDGRSELLFSVAGYDKGGYAIAWGGSFRLVRYEWSYH